MKLRSDSRAAVTAHKAATSALDANAGAQRASGVTEETETYRELNATVGQTNQHVSVFRRRGHS